MSQEKAEEHELKQRQIDDYLPPLSVVEDAAVEVGHDVVLAVVDQQGDAVVLQGPLGVSSGDSHRHEMLAGMVDN